MPSLHETIEKIKKLLLWGAIGTGAIIIVVILFRIGASIFGALNPPKIPLPTVAFGSLPQPIFPKNVINEKFHYTNNTLSGSLPDFPDRLIVYKIHQNTGTLLNLSDAKSDVAAVGFTPDPISSDAAQIQLTPTQYQWTTSKDLSKEVTMDIVSKNFVFKSDFMTYAPALSATFLPNQTDAVQTAIGFLSQIGAPTDDLGIEKTKTTLLSIQNGTLVNTDSITQAQVIRIDFFQKDINKLPVVYQTPGESPMNVFVASGEFTGQVVEANYFHQGYDKNTDSTYPLISAQVAYNRLKNGQAYIASFNGTTTDVLINNIYLGYYISDTPQQYLQPVVVFEGNNNFVAYVPAIDYTKMKNLLVPQPQK